MSQFYAHPRPLGAVSTRAWAAAAASLAVVAGGLLVAAPAAHADEPCSSATFTTSGTCTLAAGESIDFTIKGGNGGQGSAGGRGGRGADAGAAPYRYLGGAGGDGGSGGAGGAGAKVTGTIVNDSATAMTLDIVVGADGSSATLPGTDGEPGRGPGGSGTQNITGNPGQDGGTGLAGGAGMPSSITDSGLGTVVVTAEGGEGGQGGAGGKGGLGGVYLAPVTPGGPASGSNGAAGANGAVGATGAAGDALPSPLPKGWTLDTSGTGIPQVVFGAATPVPVTIIIAGIRDGKSAIIMVDGRTTGLRGATVTPFVKKAGQSSFAQGVNSPTVGDDGSFAWQRKSHKKTFVYFTSGSVKSNTVAIAAQ